jgi:hypothetical protein
MMIVDFGPGAEFISDGLAHTGRFKALYFKEETVISAITAENYTGNALAGETFPADSMIYGIFTSVTLTSGACIAYRI